MHWWWFLCPSIFKIGKKTFLYCLIIHILGHYAITDADIYYFHHHIYSITTFYSHFSHWEKDFFERLLNLSNITIINLKKKYNVILNLSYHQDILKLLSPWKSEKKDFKERSLQSCVPLSLLSNVSQILENKHSPHFWLDYTIKYHF